ncbi:hypothetical protein L3X38_024469 [Prunus dulcis]|uniref:Uncharacterized protein n=1 Tax=Prunus dulcis TaxID=3755 RepID=A0AAD4W2E3_PRUDU|nr:hypothetical protein L3X38_024469 [Prunus dulcis]
MEFKPERWLDGDGMKLVVAAVMYEFEVMVVNGGATVEKMMNPPYILSLVLKMKDRLVVGRIKDNDNPTMLRDKR